MAIKKRVPMQVSPRFVEGLKDLQLSIRNKTKQNLSLTQLTDKISNHFDEIEKAIIDIKEPKIEFKVKFDRRML